MIGIHDCDARLGYLIEILENKMSRSTKLTIDPPLLNSASPWATTYEDLKALYDCPFTGAVTVRTSLLKGFGHDDAVHQYCFFEGGAAAIASEDDARVSGPETGTGETGVLSGSISASGGSSLNTLGYSPIPLGQYLEIVQRVVEEGGKEMGEGKGKRKPVVLSVTGTPEEVEEMYLMIGRAMEESCLILGMEINLSCPNIKGKPPPAYDGASLAEFLTLIRAQKGMVEDALGKSTTGVGDEEGVGLPAVGIKLPPYTYLGQFEEVVGAIAAATLAGRSVVDFVTSTNTLGSSLVLDGACRPTLASEAGTGIGGLAGASLHPLALGNVATLRRVLDEREETRNVMVIGVGGVGDRAGFDRMSSVGAGAVAVATALGREGVVVFEKILGGES